MSNLSLSISVGDYDRTRPLLDGAVRIDGVDPVFLALEPEEIFFRAIRHAEFDVCELSLSSYTASLARGQPSYIGIPVYPSRAFRHTAFYVRADSPIVSLNALRGRRVGLPEYQLTACVWARLLMAEEGVAASDVQWIRGGLETPGRPEKLRLNLPPDIQLKTAPVDGTLSQMLLSGEIDALVSPRVPSGMRSGKVRWLLPDPVAAAKDFYRRTEIFPIMHLLAIRRTLYERHRWLPATLLKAFERAKTAAIERLEDNAATKVTLPFVEERVAEARGLLGEDYWSYGLSANRKVLEVFLQAHQRQGVSDRLVRVEELFAPEACESYVI